MGCLNKFCRLDKSFVLLKSPRLVALAANSEKYTQCTTACLAVYQRPSVPRKQILGEYRTIVRLGETGGLPFPCMYLYVVVARVHAVLSLSLPSHDLLISLGREHFRLLVNQVAFRAVFQML